MKNEKDFIKIKVDDIWELINKPRRFFRAIWDELYEIDKNDGLEETLGKDKKEVINNVLRWERIGKNPMAAARDCKKNITEVLKFFDEHCIELDDEVESKIMTEIADDIYRCFDDEYFDAYQNKKEEEKQQRKSPIKEAMKLLRDNGYKITKE